MNLQGKDAYIGDEALKKRKTLQLNYVTRNSIVENWEDMEKVLDHIFYNELQVTPEELKGIMVTEPPGNPKQCTEKMTQVLFETF